MWNEPSREELDALPRLYDTEDVHADEKIVYMHFFLASCDWYIVEFDGDDTFFGYVYLGVPEDAEWGYISFTDLIEINIGGQEVDRDLFWKPKTFGEIEI